MIKTKISGLGLVTMVRPIFFLLILFLPISSICCFRINQKSANYGEKETTFPGNDQGFPNPADMWLCLPKNVDGFVANKPSFKYVMDNSDKHKIWYSQLFVSCFDKDDRSFIVIVDGGLSMEAKLDKEAGWDKHRYTMMSGHKVYRQEFAPPDPGLYGFLIFINDISLQFGGRVTEETATHFIEQVDYDKLKTLAK